MTDNLQRDIGRMEGKIDAMLEAISEMKDDSEDLHSRVSGVERRLDEVKWTIRGVLLAGSLIGSFVSTAGVFIWKWLTGALSP
jgi:hypothetical protein